MTTYDKNTTAAELVGDLSDQIKGKVILTTGVSPGGLGAIFAEAIAKAQPAELILASRNSAKVQETVDTITKSCPDVKIRALELDLGSLAAVRDAAAKVNSWDDLPYIDVLVNNAAIMGTEFALSPDGFENQLATNHLGPFLFTNLIMNKMVAAKSPRIIFVSSAGHRLSPFRFGDYNFHDGENYDRWRAYGQSKTANMLTALSMAEKLGSKHGVLAFSLHPGTINTNLGQHLDWNTDFAALVSVDKEMGNSEGWRKDFEWKTPDQGAATHVYAAFDPSLKDHNGVYLQDSHVADPWVDSVKPWGTSLVEAQKLWKLSEELVGQEFSY